MTQQPLSSVSGPDSGRTWYAQFASTRINITPIILPKKIEDPIETLEFTSSRWARPECGIGSPARLPTPVVARPPRRHHQAEFRFLGIVSSLAFVSQSEGNGCIERFLGTLKEQLLWVRHFTDVEDLQQALRIFKETYDQQWLIERLGFRAPAVARRTFALMLAA